MLIRMATILSANGSVSLCLSIRRARISQLSYDKATEINPNDASAWNYKACLFANNNKNEEALYFAERSLEIDPNNAAVLDTKGIHIL